MTPNETFLLDMRDAATQAGHIWPEYAACESAIESAEPPKPGDEPNANFGKSELFLKANNIFGQKAPAKVLPGMKTIAIETDEYIHGQTHTMNANWLMFDSIADCFAARMALLKRLPSIYGQALAAKNGEEFVQQVSAVWVPSLVTPAGSPLVFTFNGSLWRWVQGRWSTGPARAHDVVITHNAHAALFTANPYVAPAVETVAI
jgi:hypothetical protein